METRNIEKKRTTLSEFFTVFGMLFLFLALFFLAINPARRYLESRDNERKSETRALMEAVSRCIYNANGIFPEAIQNIDFDTYSIIGTQQNCHARCDFVDVEDSCLDLSQSQCGGSTIFIPDFIVELPKDPDKTLWNDKITGYYLTKTSKGEIKIGACNPSLQEIEESGEFTGTL